MKPNVHYVACRRRAAQVRVLLGITGGKEIFGGLA
jgi:hypothetical protein